MIAARPPRKTVTRAAVAFDLSPSFEGMEKFIPGMEDVIRPAVESPPVRKGAIVGPGSGLSTTPPAPPPVGRGGGGRAARGMPPPIPPPAPAPDISPVAAGIEQKKHGERPPLQPLASFDGL